MDYKSATQDSARLAPDLILDIFGLLVAYMGHFVYVMENLTAFNV